MPQGEGTYGSTVGRPPKKSPNKIKNVGYDYKPFQMKAAGPKYKNSPIEKNYGSPAQRGFDFTGGVGSKEMEGGVGSAFDYASPAKGWFSNIAKKVKRVGAGVLTGGISEIVRARKKKKQAAAAAAAGAEASGGIASIGGGGEVPQHGDEAHAGGGGKQGGKMWGGLSGANATAGGGGMGKFGRMGIGGQAATAEGDLGSGQGPEIAEEEMA